jgi:hypothetical protein
VVLGSRIRFCFSLKDCSVDCCSDSHIINKLKYAPVNFLSPLRPCQIENVRSIEFSMHLRGSEQIQAVTTQSIQFK